MDSGIYIAIFSISSSVVDVQWREKPAKTSLRLQEHPLAVPSGSQLPQVRFDFSRHFLNFICLAQ